jgi:hypothetical protein
MKITTQDQMIDNLSGILAVLPTIALLEFSRQFGYIGAQCGLPVGHLNKNIIQEEGALGKWRAAIATDTFSIISEELKNNQLFEQNKRQ